MSNLGKQGQTFIEFVVFSGVALVVLAGVASMWIAQFKRSQCIYSVFEKAHALVIGAEYHSQSQTKLRIDIQEDPEHVRAIGYCSGVREVVDLPRLESAQW